MTTAIAAVARRTAAHARAESTINPFPRQGARGAARWTPGARSSLRAHPFEPHAAPAAGTCRAFADQLDPGGRQRLDELHQRIDVPSDHPVARFHALDG